ncbi:MAG TPA: flagellar M-ring protein FliF C-terminal domain-containing protein, partial [Acidimicrobiia bacterium]|nr:flagellar M-ring protein FliF C-terminal domain-containing protein [Acidimicrobiia bacterium]
VDTGGTKLSNEAVQSIVNIVASSVADMTPESVTLTDANMNLLHAAGQSLTGGSGDTMEAKAAFEAQMAKSLTDFIAASLGPGHARVDVEAQLDMSSGETHSQEFTQPTGGQTPTQETTSSENFSGPGQDAAGIVGPDGTPSTPNSTPVSYTKTEADRQLAVNMIEQTKKEAPGTLERLSVSVLMDSEKVAAGDQTAWETALSTAAGIDTARADAITVTRMPFDTEAQKAATENLKAASSAASSNAMLDMIRYFVTFLIVGLVLFLAWRAIKKAEVNRVPIRVPLDLAQLEAGERRMEPAMAGVEQSLRLPAAAAPAERAAPSLEAANVPVEEEIAGIIEQQPDEVALTLRSWLADRRG